MTSQPGPRTETDSFGPIDVPGNALWGAQTERSLRFFAIGEQRMPLAIVHALAQVKRAAAEVNCDLGLLDPARARAVATAAMRVAAVEFDAQFPLSVWQTGSGTQSHMNVNEVIASPASAALGGGSGAERRVHPNDDVNLGQSSNDVFPTATHVAVVLRTRPLLGLHAALRTLAVALNKMANDIRLMGSGPPAGQSELRPAADESGSSIMPGKVNPTQAEAKTMVCAQVMGHDVAIGIAASQGQFELRVYKPLIAYDVLDSLRLLADAMASFTVHCIEGIEVSAERAQSLLTHTPMFVTALVPHIGYDRAARIARYAHERELDLRQAAIDVGDISAAECDAWVDVRRMLGPG